MSSKLEVKARQVAAEFRRDMKDSAGDCECDLEVYISNALREVVLEAADVAAQQEIGPRSAACLKKHVLAHFELTERKP